MRLAVVIAAGVIGATGVAAGDAGLPGARAIRTCAAAGPYWPTMTLTLTGSSAWIACKQQSRVIRVSTTSGKRIKSVPLRAPAIAVAAGFGSIWALDSSATLYRLNARTGGVVKRTTLEVYAPYNIWIGGGSVWVADDRRGNVVRISPRTNKVLAQIPVGDGPSSIAFDPATAWVINHRETTIHRIDLATNRSTLLTRLGGEAPERIVWFHDRLWVTGRGTDLLTVNPAGGKVERTIEIGASGIDLVAAGDDIWIPTRSAATDPSGFPTMDALKRVSVSSGSVVTVAEPTIRLDVHGLRAANGAIWLADNRSGYLYRVPAR
jgi:YVTN family beta-propeller protein